MAEASEAQRRIIYPSLTYNNLRLVRLCWLMERSQMPGVSWEECAQPRRNERDVGLVEASSTSSNSPKHSQQLCASMEL
jgi:hypothetical protein